MKLEGHASILDKALDVFSDLPEAKSAIEDLIKISSQLNTANVK